MSLLPRTGSAAAQTALKVLHLTPEYPPHTVGGLGTHVSELTTGLSAIGCHVSVIAPTTDLVPPPVQQIDNIAVHRVVPQGIRANLSHLAINSETKKIIALNQSIIDCGRRFKSADQRPDLIHAHDWLFPAAHELGSYLEVPVVVTVHLLQNPISAWWGNTPRIEDIAYERDMCDHADMIIAVSHSLRSIIAGTYKVPQERLQVVHNGLDARPFQPAALNPALRARLRQTLAPADAPLVLFAGRLDPQKGLDALFAAADLVLEELPAVRYLIVGETTTPEDDAMVQALVARYPRVQRQTRFLGRVPRAQLAQLYQVADLALVPSVYEPFGYAALEAIAAGVPVVATAVGGLAEIIEHGQTGWLVPVHAPSNGRHQVDVTALAAAQIELLHDRALGRRLAASAQASVIERFTLPAMTAATLEVYRRTLDHVRASVPSRITQR